jgi:hypothetical protein
MEDKTNVTGVEAGQTNAEETNEQEPFLVVNVGGVDIGYSKEQVQADLGRGRMYNKAKKESSRYKHSAKAYEKLGFDDNMTQAIYDAKNGDEKAIEYVNKHLFPNQDEAGEYTPEVKVSNLPSFLEVAKERNDGSYENFTRVIEGEGYDIKSDIGNLNITDEKKEQFMENFMADVTAGVFEKTLPLASAIQSQTGSTLLEAYVKANEKLVLAAKEEQEDNKQPQANTNNNQSTNTGSGFDSLRGQERTDAVALRKKELMAKFG